MYRGTIIWNEDEMDDESFTIVRSLVYPRLVLEVWAPPFTTCPELPAQWRLAEGSPFPRSGDEVEVTRVGTRKETSGDQTLEAPIYEIDLVERYRD